MWEKKNMRTPKYNKRTVTCDVGAAQWKDGIIKYEKKKKEPPNVTKILSNVMLKLHTMRMESSNVRKKNKETIKCDKRIITCDVGITQCENGIVKCKKKIRKPPSVTKEQSRIMLVVHNVKMELSNMRKK